MAVRKTESRLPANILPQDLGHAVVQGDYALISKLPSELPTGSFNEYAVFVLNGAPADAYRWTFRDVATGDTLRAEVTVQGVTVYRVDAPGAFDLQVEVLVTDAASPAATLLLPHTVVPAAPDLRAYLPSGAGPGDLPASWQLVNELRPDILDAARATGAQGIPARLLAAVVYNELLMRPRTETERRLLLPAGDLLQPPLERDPDLFYAADELNNPDRFRPWGSPLDGPLGVCQMNPWLLAMDLNLIPWREGSGQKASGTPADVESDWKRLSNDERIDLFNLLRFPKANIAACARLLARLKNRRAPTLTTNQLLEQANEKVLRVLATEYRQGPVRIPAAQVKPDDYGGRCVPALTRQPLIQAFFSKLTVTASLMSRGLGSNNQPFYEGLQYLSLDEHPYNDGQTVASGAGVTVVYGTVLVEGEPDDELVRLEMDVIQDRHTVAQFTLAADAQAILGSFNPAGRREIKTVTRLFDLVSGQTQNVGKQADSNLYLVVRATTRNGASGSTTYRQTAAPMYGPVQLLVRYNGTSRYGTRDPEAGGDDWVLPSARRMVEHFAATFTDLTFNDFSRMNGGRFPPHHSHRTGADVDGHFPGYNQRDAGVADKLIAHLNDATYGSNIEQVFVTYQESNSNVFYKAIKGKTLSDGKTLVTEKIRPATNHDTHFHWRFKVNP